MKKYEAETGDEEASPNVEAGAEDLGSEDRAFATGLLRSARSDEPSAALEARVLRHLAHRAERPTRGAAARLRRAVVVGAFVAAAAAAALLVRIGHRGSGAIVPDAPRRSSGSSAVEDACGRRVRAAGAEPRIDDFEDGNDAVLPFEGRAAHWYVAKDSEARGTSSPIFPTLRAEPQVGNRFALHAQGGELRDWGASIEIKFMPPCYDASKYAGVVFSARGPGRLYFAAREVRIVGVEFGGTCTHDCYNAHARKVDLDAGWRRIEVRWVELRQRGYDTPPLDPQSLHSLSFQIHPEDTPYDLWIDDVQFLTR